MTTSERPENVDVTVIVTCYNHQAYIEQCLASVRTQDTTPREVIVVDDSSTDDSADVIERWLDRHDAPFRFIRHAVNRGVCASLNEALSGVDSAYFCHISGDDWIPADRVRVQSRALDNAPADSAAVLGDLREVDAGGVTLATHDIGARLAGLVGEGNRGAMHDRLLQENVIPAPAVMLRTSAVRDVGGFDEALAFEDYDMWLQLSHRFAFAHAPGVVSYYRLLGSSLTRNPRRALEMVDSQIRILRKHLGESAGDDAVITERLVELATAADEINAETRSPADGPGRLPALLRRERPDRRSSKDLSAD